MIARRLILVRRAVSAGFDSEGRPAAGSFAVASQTVGHLVRRDIATTMDGRIVTVATVRALLPTGVDVRPADVLSPADAPSERYRVLSVSVRQSPAGGVHHLSCECEIEL